MTKKNLSITIAIGFIALFGIIAVQIHWIYTAYSQNKISFEQNLNKALNQIVHDISRQENIFFTEDFDQDVHYINGNSGIVHVDSLLKKQIKWQHKFEDEEIIRFDTQKKKAKEELKRIKVKSNSKNRYIVRSIVGNDVEIMQEIHMDSLTDHMEAELELKTSAYALIKKDSILKKYEARIDSVRQILDYNILSIVSEKEDINKTMVELIMNIKSVTRPFADRLPIDKLEISIQKAIERYNLPKTYAFAIATVPHDSIVYKTENFNTDELNREHAIKLFPQDFAQSSEHLYISFPEANPLFNHMLWPISLAFIFTLLLLASLLIIINNLLHHKKLSAIKTDFINNMTHEFKTPIATIQLAADSVMTEQILNQPDKVGYFMRLIKGENKRMNILVERILQMAQLEKKSFSLIKTEVDIHQLIEAVVENSQLKIEQAQGQIKLNLNASQSLLKLDDMHITNVLFNLIDNAVKYRNEGLLIEISTRIANKQFHLLIKDNGQGMNSETLDHIFDKFFRLTEGNVHTVKGYGLGLSYVKAIIDKHKGQIQVQSQLGQGSTFEIRLPLI